jgi:hypothetical protein
LVYPLVARWSLAAFVSYRKMAAFASLVGRE